MYQVLHVCNGCNHIAPIKDLWGLREKIHRKEDEMFSSASGTHQAWIYLVL